MLQLKKLTKHNFDKVWAANTYNTTKYKNTQQVAQKTMNMGVYRGQYKGLN